MKRAYFIRHGESEYNAKRLYQSIDVPLSQLGIKQAKLVAKKFEKIPIDLVVASSSKRALQTAKEINSVVRTKIIETELLHELKNPTVIVGKAYLDEEASGIKELIKKNYSDIKWHHSDEENLYDLMQRARKFLQFVCSREEENVLIVTHAGVMKMIIAVMIFGEKLDVEIFNRFNLAFDVNNSGITICEQAEEGVWRVLAWNDYVHLGSIKSERGQGL